MPKLKPAPLRELHFGTLDAAQEAVDEPRLLLEGFFDYREAAYGIASRGRWLLLGQKGAGKSAVLEHLRLKWADRWDRFFTLWDLRTFPVRDVPLIDTGQSAGAARAHATWEFLLLLRIIESLKKDQALVSSTRFDDLTKELGRRGFFNDDWPRKVARWKTNIGVDIRVLKIGTERASGESVTPLDVSACIREILTQVRTDSQHLLALDGLDSFFFEEDDEWRSLAGLLHAAESLNRFMKSERLPISIAVAMRSDIFNILPSADLNKLKPMSIHLDWSALGIGESNKLWTMVDGKAAVLRPELRRKGIVETYLQEPINLGIHTSAPTYILDHTRLLPRDLVSLLNYVKEEHPGSTPVSEANLKQAVLRYCREYFEGEIFDNLAGVLAPGNSRKLSSFKEALRTLPTREFTYDEIVRELSGDLEVVDVKSLLKQMFDIGGIGIRNLSGTVAHTDFTYRNINGSGFSVRHNFLLHDALTRGWNRPWK